MIQLENLTKQFGAIVAVKNLSFDIAEGEIFGLIGPDGAGKTTTLRVISTAMLPTSGSVRVNTLDVVRDAEAVKKLIGYMPQRFALYRDLTVIENLNFFADLFGAPPAERRERVERLLGFARLTEFQSRRAANLSGGMQKKLALAATLMHHPRVLLLDEPTTGVDPVSRREFWDLVTQVHLDGRTISPTDQNRPSGSSVRGESVRKVTIVISTPYLDEAERCTRVGLMQHGQLIACDTPLALRLNLNATVLEGRTAQAMRARTISAAQDGVLNATMHGDIVRLLVDRADRQSVLASAWQAQNIPVQNLHIVSPRLEDAFVLVTTENDK
jgi:ABC-2 type transport system ATP-binding protein